MKYNVGIFLYDSVELLDLAGPGESFTSAKKEGEILFNVFTVAKTGSPILCQNFLTLLPKFSFDDVPDIDILILPGGDTYLFLADEDIIHWITEVTQKAKFVLSVCTGVLFLAQSGCLDGHQATTHYKWITFLRENFKNVDVVEGVRFIDTGKIITTEGVSAGIDGSLYLIERIFGTLVAKELAYYMMYDWRPEALNVIK